MGSWMGVVYNVSMRTWGESGTGQEVKLSLNRVGISGSEYFIEEQVKVLNVV